MFRNANSEMMMSSTEAAKMLIQSNTAAQLAGSMVMNGGASFLLQVIDQLQLVIHLPLLILRMPSNVMEFFSICVPIITFDLLENVDEYNDSIEMVTRSKKEEVDEGTQRRILEQADNTLAKDYIRLSDQT